jgi:hypothetical protein
MHLGNGFFALMDAVCGLSTLALLAVAIAVRLRSVRTVKISSK